MPETTTKRILHVDDDETTRYTISRILTRAGFEVIEASDGNAALERVKERPDLVLLDVNLPDMNGFEVCQRIKSDPDTASIPIVHLSSTHVHSRDRTTGLDGGADGYMVHPVDARELEATVRAFLRSRETEKRLHESEARYRLLFECESNAIAIVDADNYLIIDANPAMTTLHGYSRNELLEMRVLDLSAEPELSVTKIEEAKQTGSARVPQRRNRRKDGAEIIVEITANTFPWQGRLAISAIFRDITEHVKAEAENRREEARLKFVWDINQRARALSEKELLDEVMEVAVTFTESTIGYVHAVHADQESIEPLKWSKAALETRTAIDDSHYPLALAGAWADCVRLKRPVVHNDYPALSYEKGYPVADIPITRHLAVPVVDGDKVALVVGVGNKPSDYTANDERQLVLIADHLWRMLSGKRAEIEIQDYVRRLEQAMLGTLTAVSTVAETRDPYTTGHERRVTHLACVIAEQMGLAAEAQQGLRAAASVHDVGKIAVPTEILCKPGKLSRIEFEIIKTHAQVGYNILKSVKFPWPVAQTILQHHERLDGSGYPQELKGNEIMLEARILAVADTVEAMASDRPYRPGLGIARALDEIERCSGQLFDPEVAQTCLRLFREGGYAWPS